MRRVVIREEANGRYSLRNFGAALAGVDGMEPFRLIVESRNRDLRMEFPETRLFDLFTTFDLGLADFLENRVSREAFLRVSFEGDECVVEASSGTLYDFFKERAAAEDCHLHCSRRIAFYWRGNAEEAA